MAAMMAIHGMPASPLLGSDELSQMLLARHFMTMKARRGAQEHDDDAQRGVVGEELDDGDADSSSIGV